MKRQRLRHPPVSTGCGSFGPTLRMASEWLPFVVLPVLSVSVIVYPFGSPP